MSTVTDNFITLENINEIQDIVNGDFLFTISNGIIYKLDFSNFIISKENTDFFTTIDSISSQVVTNTLAIEDLLENGVATQAGTVVSSNGVVRSYEFILRNDSNGYADTSWAEIIDAGQALQKPQYDISLEEFGRFTNIGAGSSGMPVISIICEEPEYNFQYTANLPSRFEVTCKRRWGSILRFYCNGSSENGPILYDNAGDGRLNLTTNSAIGIYVEPDSQVSIAGNSVNRMETKPFEQTISNIIIVPMGPNSFPEGSSPRAGRGGNVQGVIPVYIAGQPDRFLMDTVKIIQTGSGQAKFSIKHGRNLGPIRNSTPLGGDPTYIRDGNFRNLQLEGPGSSVVQYGGTAVYVQGTNIQFTSITFYYWQSGLYIFNSQNIVVNGISMNNTSVDDRALMPVTIVTENLFDSLNDEQVLRFNKAGIGPIGMAIGNVQGLVTLPGINVSQSYELNGYDNPGYVVGTGLGMYYKNGIWGESIGTPE